MNKLKVSGESLKNSWNSASKPVKNYFDLLSGKKVKGLSAKLYGVLDEQTSAFAGPYANKMKKKKAISLVGLTHKELKDAMKSQKKTRLITGGTAAAAFGTGGVGLALRNSNKKEAAADNIGPYGNEEHSQQALDSVFGGMRRGAVKGIIPGVVGGGAFGSLVGGIKAKNTLKGVGQGALAGAVVGALAHAAYGGIKGGMDAEKALPPVEVKTAGLSIDKSKQAIRSLARKYTTALKGTNYRAAQSTLDANNALAISRGRIGSGQWDFFRNLQKNVAKERGNMWKTRAATVGVGGGVGAGMGVGIHNLVNKNDN